VLIFIILFQQLHINDNKSYGWELNNNILFIQKGIGGEAPDSFSFFSVHLKQLFMEPITHQIDLITWERLSDGNENAFRIVVHAFNRRWMNYVVNLLKSETDARDVLQESWVKVWLAREQLKGMEKPEAWINTILTNSAYDYLRTQARRGKLNSKVSLTEKQDVSEFWKELDTKSMQDTIEEAVDQLPARQREIFRLARLEGYTRKQIAGKLGLSENTVRNHLSEALSTIQEFLKSRDALLVPITIWLTIESSLSLTTAIVFN
jgi:RNA polymerase sigma-70 factor (family 1)